jgi:hypothetical protein
MKKLLTLLFTLAIAFSMTMPVFGQEAPSETGATKTEKKKHKKAPKEKKKKKGSGEAAPPSGGTQ